MDRPHSPAERRSGTWLPLGVIGVVACLAGVVLPQLLPSTTPTAPKVVDVAVKRDKADWQYAPPAWPEAPNHGAMLARLGIGTLAVLGLCVATLWCCQRWLKGNLPAPAAGALLRCVESLPLGNRCTVHLVHLGDRPVLVGTDAGGIKTIVPLPESFDATMLTTQEAAPL